MHNYCLFMADVQLPGFKFLFCYAVHFYECVFMYKMYYPQPNNSIHTYAEYPQPPEAIDITRLGTADTNATIQYCIKWNVPPNNEEFDLDHYELTIGKNITYIHSNETAAIISIKKETLTSAIVVKIVAFDKCGKKSESKNKTLMVVSPAGLEKSTSDTSCTCATEISISIVLTSLFFFVVGIVTMIIVVYKLRLKNTSESECSNATDGAKYKVTVSVLPLRVYILGRVPSIALV